MGTSMTTPLARAEANPGSRRAAVDATCWRCMGGDETYDRGVVGAIRDCDAKLCYLHPVRPYAGDRRRLPVLQGTARGQKNAMERLSDGDEKPSLKRCVEAHCYSCVAEKDRGLSRRTVEEVRDCSAPRCPIRPVRGYR